MDMNMKKDLVFISELFSQRKHFLDKEKRRKAMQEFKIAAEPLCKHPIATAMAVLWLCIFSYAVVSVWNEEWIIIAFVAGFWLMILFMGIGYCENLYELSQGDAEKTEPIEIKVHLTVECNDKS